MRRLLLNLNSLGLAMTVVCAVFCLLLADSALAETKCFLAMEHGRILKQEGDCDKRRPPCSTFKIPISLMGFEEGILVDEHTPTLPYDESYQARLEQHKQAIDPTSWMRVSAVWYSQLITKQLGMDKFSDYVKRMDYGNLDVSGDPGKSNGLTHAWLSSSLRISPRAQEALIKKLVRSELPFSARAQQLTRNILFWEDFDGGFKLYGKTGSGDRVDDNGNRDPDHQIGWFVGWLQRADRVITFAHFIEIDTKEGVFAGPQARELAKEKLRGLVTE